MAVVIKPSIGLFNLKCCNRKFLTDNFFYSVFKGEGRKKKEEERLIINIELVIY
ncbi:hypothetical protein [Okeania sp. SIO2B3]|uniref:hypothetical protein n=1 Tax=Okeania sp. SIO2B3 TaxID=2607784 RepID=UPI0013B98523|nr:hypothetical protein [Okeania sp. SIO2B3]NEN93349.1 hypothetical protein [Okeania sp. SIO3H1]NES69260.1 hypothetical protein [Okeania sp. SIO2D1]